MLLQLGVIASLSHLEMMIFDSTAVIERGSCMSEVGICCGCLCTRYGRFVLCDPRIIGRVTDSLLVGRERFTSAAVYELANRTADDVLALRTHSRYRRKRRRSSCIHGGSEYAVNYYGLAEMITRLAYFGAGPTIRRMGVSWFA